ncbi:PAS sensor protein [Gemmatirosa kalamazoonensis]|uniref:histidine kinase n=1 Tax=Gemmatirosa kalamazoonensis TaxID=861299 RepID=W0RQ57_9BACT|nr:PAS domain S-box protein [Gemmatirosa kalamazoonensis]AHG91648.1 PAS sensor protein [Gemmatirosa kalamazoonensis]
MTSPAPTGLAGAPTPFTADASSLDRLLSDLRRRSWGDPTANAVGLLRIAAEALGAHTLVVWLPGASGGLEPMVHHPLGVVSCEHPTLWDVAGDRPNADALATDDAAERREGDAAVLDVALWTGGRLGGVLCAKRGASAPWTPAERSFLARLADRLAGEATAEGKRLAEQALREREQQMDLVEQIAGLGSWEIDLRSDAITWSREQSRIHGFDVETRPRTHTEFMAMVHPDDRRIIDDGMARLTGLAPVTVEFRIVRPDGEIRLLQAQGLLAPGVDGEYSRVIGTSLDITERRATELALRASEESYRAIFDSSNDAIFVQDLETGRILDANRRACEVNDVTLDELRASGLSVIANGPPPFTPDRALAYMHRAAAGESVRFEWMTVHRKTHEEMWVEVSLQRVTIRGEARLLALVRDIRDRKQVELALRASEENYRGIFENASDAMWMHDVDTGAFLEVNRAAEEIYGFTAEEQKAGGVPLISDNRPPYTPEASLEYLRRAAAGEPQRFEWLCRHKDGRPVWNEVRLRRVNIGGVDRVLATARDINDRKAAEQRLRASEESYRTIFQSASDAMWLHDVDTGAFLDVNNAAVELYGFSADEQKALGIAGISDGRAPYTPEQGWRYLQQAAAGLTPRFEWLGRHKDGRAVWAEVRLRRVTLAGVDRILATARDTNDRKRAEAALREANEVLELRVEARTAELAAEVAEHARAKEALLQRTRELEGIFQALPDLYFRLSSELRILDYRASSTDRLYVPPEAFLGKRLRDVMPVELCDRFDEALHDARPGELATVEYELPAGDEMRDFEARFFPLVDGSYISVVRDITDRKRVERALREREAQLRETQRIARLGSWQMDLRTGQLAWDAVVCELYGVTPASAPRDLEGYLALVHPHDRDFAREVSAQARATGKPFSFDHRVVHPDGTVRHLHGRGSLVTAPDGTPLRMVGSSQDVTERKVAERALAEREEHFRRLIENTSDFVMIVDETAAITYVGPSVERMLGWQPEEMMGTRPSDLVHPDDVPRVMEDFQWIVEHPGQTHNSTFRIRCKDGTYRVFENLGRTLSPSSAAEGIVANGRDITERKLGEEALARAKEEAERANRAKSEFLSRMSHELRTPMNSILGFAQLLQRAELPPQHGKAVGHILKAGRHLLHLINEVLEIARIEAGRENFSLEPVALASVLQEAFGLVRPLAQQWEVELREGAWPSDAFVQADRQRLVQVLLNLLSNAIKYNRRGGHVRLTSVQADGRWIVRVEDSGRGIPAERAGQLFTPFARLGAEQTEVEGTGLGLALSRRLCEAMGGSLALETTGGDGSTFRLELDGAVDPLGTLEETGTFAVPAGPHREATLLYVEDNLANLSLVDTILLSRPGWRTMPALQGQLGVELAREHLPDVILLDLHLPDIPGEEVLRRLRGDARTARIPIVVVSADATPTSLERLRASGADAYLTKPLDVDEFLRVVESFLPPGGARTRA